MSRSLLFLLAGLGAVADLLNTNWEFVDGNNFTTLDGNNFVFLDQG